jgi:hypothetical protein
MIGKDALRVLLTYDGSAKPMKLNEGNKREGTTSIVVAEVGTGSYAQLLVACKEVNLSRFIILLCMHVDFVALRFLTADNLAFPISLRIQLPSPRS